LSFIFHTPCVFAEEPVRAHSPAPVFSPINPKFLDWQKQQLQAQKTPRLLGSSGNKDRKPGIIPSPIDWSHLGNVQYKKASIPSKTRLATLPATFDLRNVSGKSYVTSVKNQGTEGACWAFSSLASLESTQLKRPGGSLISQWDNDLSEAHLAWFTYKDTVGFTYQEGERIYDKGGNFDMSSAILSRWTGPADEKSLPYDLSTTPNKSSAEYPRRLTLDHVYRIVMSENIDERDSSIEAAKGLIMTEGAMAASYYAGESARYYNSSAYAWYYNGESKANHAVTIIGWDDNFPVTSFNAAYRPPKPGAWLVKNSWGTTWDNQGYFWLSYWDSSLSDFALFKAAESDKYKKIYLYDELGMIASFGSEKSPSMWAANVFTATEDGLIEAVAFFTCLANLTFEARIYKGLTDLGNPASGSEAAKITGTTSFAGYYTFELPSPVKVLDDDVFSVVINITNDDEKNINIIFPCELMMVGYSSAATGKTGQSFYVTVPTSSAPPTVWKDFYNFQPPNTTNFCIRALAGPLPPLPVIKTQPQNTIDINEGESTVFEIEAEGAPPLEYQWQKYDGSAWQAIPGAKLAAYSISNAQSSHSGRYRCVVTNNGGSVTSNEVLLTVTTVPVPPTLDVQPQNGTVTIGGNASFSVTASGAAPLTYQWEKYSGVVWMAIAGANSAVYSISNVQFTHVGRYRCVVTNSKGSVTSDEVLLTVTAVTVLPTLDVQSQNRTAEEGSTATLTVSVTGAVPITYQWQKYDGTTWVNIPGATSVFYSITNVQTSNAGRYRCVVSNSAGTVISGEFNLTVTPQTAIAPEPTPSDPTPDNPGNGTGRSDGGGGGCDSGIPVTVYMLLALMLFKFGKRRGR
jgi:C1A family cysteine protease